MMVSISMRRIRTSRITRAMALLAWMLLVMVPLPAGAMAASDGMPMSMGAMVSSQGMHHDATPESQHAGCCGNPSSHSNCQCDAMCGSVLLPTLAASLSSDAPAARYAMMHSVDAPSIDPIPPLRPPAV